MSVADVESMLRELEDIAHSGSGPIQEAYSDLSGAFNAWKIRKSDTLWQKVERRAIKLREPRQSR